MNFLTQDHLGYYRGGMPVIQYYNEKIKDRREKYPFTINEKYVPMVEEMNQNGFCIMKDFFEKETLLRLLAETEELFRSKSDKTRQVQNGNHTIVTEPFLNTRTAHEIAFDQRLIDIATIFFNCVPGIGTFNLRLSEPTQNPLQGTNMFHRDFNSPVKLMKFFFYLTDVGPENGPFTYVQGSNREVPPNWSRYHRWPDEKIEEIYGADRVKNLTANFGDVIMATTNGFHKGLKIEQGRRIMFTINYLIHPEMEGARVESARPRFGIWTDDFNKLPESKKPVADFLIKKER